MNAAETVTHGESNEKIRIGAYLSALYFVCMPLSIVPIPGGFSLLKYVSFIVGGGLILNLFIGKTLVRFNAVHFLLGIYILYSIGSLFLLRSELSIVTFRGLIETSLVFYLITLNEYNRKEFMLIIYCWIIVGIVTATIMILGNVSLSDGSGRATLGFSGGKEDPNQLCGYFILPVLCCLDKINNKAKFTIIYIGLSVAITYAVFATGSRGGLIAVFSVIMAYVFLAENTSLENKIKIAFFILILAVIFVFVLFPLFPESVRERMNVQSVVEDKGSGRLDLWAAIYDAVTKSETGILFGFGLGSTTDILNNSATHSKVAHNHWLQLWCDQGLIGMSIFLGIIAAGFIRTYKRYRILALSLVGMMLLSMSLTMYAYYKPFWNILMMSALNFKKYE